MELKQQINEADGTAIDAREFATTVLDILTAQKQRIANLEAVCRDLAALAKIHGSAIEAHQRTFEDLSGVPPSPGKFGVKN